MVIDFYEGVFLKHQVQEYSDRYIGTNIFNTIRMYLMAKRHLSIISPNILKKIL